MEAVTADRDTVRPAPPTQIRVAGALVGLEGLASVVFGVLVALEAAAPGAPVGALLGEAVYFWLIGLLLGAVGVGLLLGKRVARTPGIVAQLLLLPVVYSLIGPSHQLVAGVLSLAYVAGTFLLLISEPSRRWSMSR